MVLPQTGAPLCAKRRRLRTDHLDYELPEDRIARHPTKERDSARLLVVPPGEAAPEHRHVRDLSHLLPRGSLVVVNDTRVIPARLLGKKVGTGGAAEIFLVRPAPPAASDVARAVDVSHPNTVPRDTEGAEGPTETRFMAMGRSSKPLRPGSAVTFGDGSLTATIVRRDEEAGLLEVALRSTSGTVSAAIERFGHVPLPPYLRRADEDADRERYQTVFAKVPGAIAAPTAGLHLSQALLDDLSACDMERASVTLHVGLGTFQPVTVSDLDAHPMHVETFVVPDETAAAIARARSRNAKIVAIGTTVVRALESAADPDAPGLVRPTAGETRLLIQPGFRFRVVDTLLTNFHLPRSTLLALVYAFAGTSRVRAAYDVAIAEHYRFYSYGDAMLLSRDNEVNQ